jgi:hypothetical protein
VFCHQFGVQWRQVAMPIDDFGSPLIIRSVHMTPWLEKAAKRPRFLDSPRPRPPTEL